MDMPGHFLVAFWMLARVLADNASISALKVNIGLLDHTPLIYTKYIPRCPFLQERWPWNGTGRAILAGLEDRIPGDQRKRQKATTLWRRRVRQGPGKVACTKCTRYQIQLTGKRQSCLEDFHHAGWTQRLIASSIPPPPPGRHASTPD